jgi:hypothetical protein
LTFSKSPFSAGALSPEDVGDRQPAMWFHDIFRSNGAPYSQAEIDFIAEPAPTAKMAKQ